MGVGLGEGLGGLGALPGPLGHSGLHTLSSLLWFLPETEGRGTDGWCLGRQSLPGGHGCFLVPLPRCEQRGREVLS